MEFWWSAHIFYVKKMGSSFHENNHFQAILRLCHFLGWWKGDPFQLKGWIGALKNGRGSKGRGLNHLEKMYQMEFWWNNHFLCKDVESFNWNNFLYTIRCSGSTATKMNFLVWWTGKTSNSPNCFETYLKCISRHLSIGELWNMLWYEVRISMAKNWNLSLWI